MAGEWTNDKLSNKRFSASIPSVCKYPQADCIQAFFATQERQLKLHRVDLPELSAQNVTIDLVRDDLMHPMIAGNKWWKLKHALIHAAKQNKTTLVTFGGAYSNHLLAVAAAGYLFGFNTVGLVRGDEQRVLNPVLSQAKQWGMLLEGISRDQYRQKQTSPFLHQHLVLLRLMRSAKFPKLDQITRAVPRQPRVTFRFECCQSVAVRF